MLTEIYVDLYTGFRDAAGNVAPEQRSRRRINLRSEQQGINTAVREALHRLLDQNIDDLDKEMKR